MNETVDLTTASDEEDDEVVVFAPKLNLIFLGPPIPKPSPRARFKFNGFNRMRKPIVQTWVHNPVTEEMNAARARAMEQLISQNVASFPVFRTGPVALLVWFCCSPPLKFFVNRDRERPKGRFLQSVSGPTPPVPVSVKPDGDNLLKFLLDSLKGVVFLDDNQVSTITAYKCYDVVAPFGGRTIVEVSPGLVANVPSWYSK